MGTIEQAIQTIIEDQEAREAEPPKEPSLAFQVVNYWKEPRCGICGAKWGYLHEPGECWPWQREDERQRRYRMTFWQERMRARGIDPQKVIEAFGSRA